MSAESCEWQFFLIARISAPKRTDEGFHRIPFLTLGLAPPISDVREVP